MRRIIAGLSYVHEYRDFINPAVLEYSNSPFYSIMEKAYLSEEEDHYGFRLCLKRNKKRNVNVS